MPKLARGCPVSKLQTDEGRENILVKVVGSPGLILLSYSKMQRVGVTDHGPMSSFYTFEEPHEDEPLFL